MIQRMHDDLKFPKNVSWRMPSSTRFFVYMQTLTMR